MIPKMIHEARVLAAMLVPTWDARSRRIDASGVPTAHVAEGTLKQKLKNVEAQLADKRDERVELLKARDEARDAYAQAEDDSAGGEAFQKAQGAVGELGECEDAIQALSQQQVGILKMLGHDNETDARSRAGMALEQANGRPVGTRSLFTKEITDQLGYLANSKNRVGGIELGQIASREDLARTFGQPKAAGPEGGPEENEADVEPTTVMRRGPLRAIVPQLRRQLRLLDLIPTGTMELNTFPYVREMGNLEGAAKGTKEGEVKPQSSFEYEDAEAVARTIAEFIKVRKQALADVPALRSTIDSRITYALESALEREIVSGKNSDPELEGVLDVSGIGLVKFKEGELDADRALSAITTIYLANAMADAIVMHPLDWQAVLSAKARFGEKEEGGSGEYYGGGPFSVTPQQLWGVPLVPSIAVPQGVVLAGDFSIGVQLLFREGINVLMSDSDQDDFIRNRVTILGELRATNVVWRPAAFAKVYLTKTVEEEEL